MSEVRPCIGIMCDMSEIRQLVDRRKPYGTIVGFRKRFE